LMLTVATNAQAKGVDGVYIRPREPPGGEGGVWGRAPRCWGPSSGVAAILPPLGAWS
jgi:hypothetical protein